MGCGPLVKTMIYVIIGAQIQLKSSVNFFIFWQYRSQKKDYPWVFLQRSSKVQYLSKVSWQSVASVDSRLNSQFSIPARIEYREPFTENREPVIENRELLIENCCGLVSLAGIEYENRDALIENRDALIENRDVVIENRVSILNSILDSILDSCRDRESSVNLLLTAL